MKKEQEKEKEKVGKKSEKEEKIRGKDVKGDKEMDELTEYTKIIYIPTYL